MANKIGVIACLVCKTDVPLGEQKTGKAMYSCGWCGVQVYTRGDDSDAKLRAMARPMPSAPAAAASASAAASAKKYDAAGREVKA